MAKVTAMRISTSMNNTAQKVAVVHCQLLDWILQMAHTAIMGALMMT